jgi:hypothetical protein
MTLYCTVPILETPKNSLYVGTSYKLARMILMIGYLFFKKDLDLNCGNIIRHLISSYFLDSYGIL